MGEGAGRVMQQRRLLLLEHVACGYGQGREWCCVRLCVCGARRRAWGAGRTAKRFGRAERSNTGALAAPPVAHLTFALWLVTGAAWTWAGTLILQGQLTQCHIGLGCMPGCSRQLLSLGRRWQHCHNRMRCASPPPPSLYARGRRAHMRCRQRWKARSHAHTRSHAQRYTHGVGG